LDDGDDDEDESSMEEDVNQVYGVITCLNITKYKVCLLWLIVLFLIKMTVEIF